MKLTLTLACFFLKSAWQTDGREFLIQLRWLTSLRYVTLWTAFTVLLFAPLAALCGANAATSLPRSLPAAEGVAPAGIEQFLETMEARGFELHSFMLLRYGKVVAETWWAPYAPEVPHGLYSLSKSFTSTAVGLAIEEGRLSLDDKVISFFPESSPPQVSNHLAALRVRDLLCMAAGHEKDPQNEMVKSEDWVRAFLAQPLIRAPGTQFVYSSAATYMCSAIVQKATGMTLLDYLRSRLFEPLGITRLNIVITGETVALTAKVGDAEHSIVHGLGEWHMGDTAMPGTPTRLGAGKLATPTRKMAASAAWLDASTLELTWRYLEFPHRDTVTCRFDADRVTLSFLSSITVLGRGAPNRPILTGRKLDP